MCSFRLKIQNCLELSCVTSRYIAVQISSFRPKYLFKFWNWDMCKFCTKFGEIFGHYHKIDVTQYFVTLFLFNDKSFQN
jgi:hypothetical protein